MIRTTRIRDLDLDTCTASRRASHLSAASGLVALGEFLYVVADDEVSLGVFPATTTAGGVLRSIFPGTLPTTHARRKASKPDLEILLRVPAFADHAHGALLALGSGSTAQRARGAWFALDASGALAGEARILDLAPLYAQLRFAMPALNLEGALIAANELILLQRASRVDPRNALIRLPLDALLQAVATGAFAAQALPPRVEPIALGQRDGVPWGFTDAVALDGGGMLFSAVVEDSADTYRDGPCLGSAIGALSRDGRLEWLLPLDVQAKVEGLDVRRVDNLLHLRMVTDADDANVPGQLLGAQIDPVAAAEWHAANAT